MTNKKTIHNPILHDKKESLVSVLNHPHVRVVVNTAIPLVAYLTYNACWERLKGTIGDHSFDERVVSGGSRGHKKVDDRTAQAYLHDDAYDWKSRSPLTKEEQAGPKGQRRYVQRGGTIPPGHYNCIYIADYKKLGGEVIRLDQQADAHVYQGPLMEHAVKHGRGGFYIHGAGPKGSDGCLIFENKIRRYDLNKAIKHFTLDLHGKVILEVINDGSFILPPVITGNRYANMA
jgi:hypothetical protein